MLKILLLDVTTISLLGYKTTKGTVKMHTLLDYEGNLPAYVNVTGGKTAANRGATRTSPDSGKILKADINFFFTAAASLNYFMDSRTTLFGSITNISNMQYAVARRPAGLRLEMPRSFVLGVNVQL